MGDVPVLEISDRIIALQKPECEEGIQISRLSAVDSRAQ
jgi:hypothetical protein